MCNMTLLNINNNEINNMLISYHSSFENSEDKSYGSISKDSSIDSWMKQKFKSELSNIMNLYEFERFNI